MNEDPIANWMRRMIEANLEAMRRFNAAQTLNPCLADCPMYRRGRGCMATRCIKTREQNTVEPAKIGEQPTE